MLQNEFPIYLDYASTTMVDPLVVEIMIEHIKLMEFHGNASSAHHMFGRVARTAIEEARSNVAELINAEPEEIIWTSGATESINLALKGAAHSYKRIGNHIITVETEHKAVLEVCKKLSTEGFNVTYLTVDRDGRIDEQMLKSAIRPETILISVMHVNNETGVIQDIERISEIARSQNVLFHVDAAQSLGKIPINVKESKIDLISLCAHKIYGPKGIGALFVKSNPAILLETEMHGGGQENGLRSGTLATHQIVGMGRAFKLAKEQLDYDRQHAVSIKKTILNELSKIEGLSINTPQLNSIPNILNLSIDSIKNIILLSRLKNVAISSGSACSSSSIQSGSHVLKAMGLSDERINNSIRISWGRFTTMDDIKLGCDALKVAIKSIRN